jgi:hypothetical protein
MRERHPSSYTHSHSQHVQFGGRHRSAVGAHCRGAYLLVLPAQCVSDQTHRIRKSTHPNKMYSQRRVHTSTHSPSPTPTPTLTHRRNDVYAHTRARMSLMQTQSAKLAELTIFVSSRLVMFCNDFAGGCQVCLRVSLWRRHPRHWHSRVPRRPRVRGRCPGWCHARPRHRIGNQWGRVHWRIRIGAWRATEPVAKSALRPTIPVSNLLFLLLSFLRRAFGTVKGIVSNLMAPSWREIGAMVKCTMVWCRRGMACTRATVSTASHTAMGHSHRQLARSIAANTTWGCGTGRVC